MLREPSGFRVWGLGFRVLLQIVEIQKGAQRAAAEEEAMSSRVGLRGFGFWVLGV